MGFDNVIAGDGIGLAVTGMLIVLSGLVFISLYIAALPRLARWSQQRRQRRIERRQAPARSAPAGDGEGLDDPALRAALALVIQMELDDEQALDAQRITITRGEAQDAWAFAGKMRTLSTRI